MDRQISASEANQRFSEMLRDVQSGDSFVVTSRGRPVARVIPIADDLKAQSERLGKLLEEVKTWPRLRVEPWKREDLYE